MIVSVLVCVGFCGGTLGLLGKSVPCSHRDLVRIGMSADDVRAAVGEPHRVDRYGEEEEWRYNCNHGWGIVGVVFDKDGKVTKTSLSD